VTTSNLTAFLKTHFLSKALALSLLASGLALTPSFFGHVFATTSQLSGDLRHLRASEAQRKIETYGDRSIMGYGYLTDILRGIPDPRFFPFVRYSYYGMNAEIVFPGERTRIDRRMLVGIDLEAGDLTEGKVVDAQPMVKGRTPEGFMSGWAFLTTWDYDRLTGIKIGISNPAHAARQNFKANLLRSHAEPVSIAQWTWPSEELSDPLTLKFSEPVKEIYSRGSLPFLLFIENSPAEGSAPAEITRVEILGIKVFTEGYTVFHRENRCFAALRTSFLREIAARGPESWRRYLLGVSNVPEIKYLLEQKDAARGNQP
jgi:hypothetical protein